MNDNCYELTYKGKKNIDEILSPSRYSINTVTEIKNTNDNWFNQIIWGDNLEVLKLLRTSLSGKITLIYIDPPFSSNNTFNDFNSDFAYIDKLRGSEYLEFIRERLILLKDILSDNGSIYVHLDSKMIFEVKILMDEIFGNKNFRNLITRKKCNRKNYTKNQYGNIADYILFYTKSENYIWNRPSDTWTEEDIIREFPCVDSLTGKRFKKVPIHAPGIRNGETGKEWKGMMPPKGKHWQYTPSKLDELDAKGEIYWSSTGNPRRKHFYTEMSSLPVQDIWMNYKDITNQNTILTGYPTEKNPLLLDRIIMASSNPNDIVLDCFSGSGTTVARAELLNRKWISIDIGLLSIKTTVNRLTIGSKSLKDHKLNNSSSELFNLNPEEIKSNVSISYLDNQDEKQLEEFKSYISSIKETYHQAF